MASKVYGGNEEVFARVQRGRGYYTLALLLALIYLPSGKVNSANFAITEF